MDYTENLGYCKDSTHHYYSTARDAFNELNNHQRSLFTGNSAYSSEWARLSTWASKNGESLNEINKLAKSSNVVNPIATINESSNNIMLVVIISIMGLSAIGGYFFLRRRKED